MWLQKGNSTKRGGGGGGGGGGGNGLVAVAIDKDKGSQHALKWTVETLKNRGHHPIILIHVLHKPSTSFLSSQQGAGCVPGTGKLQLENLTKDLFLTFHCYCTRKDVQCFDVILEGNDVGKAITEYVSYAAIESLVLGSPSRHSFMRKFKTDIPGIVLKGAPDFCNVYVITKGKPSSIKYASRPAPYVSPLLDQLQNNIPTTTTTTTNNDDPVDDHDDVASRISSRSTSLTERTPARIRFSSVDDSFRSPFGRGGRAMNARSFAEMLDTESTSADVSFISSGRPSIDTSPSAAMGASDHFDYFSNPQISTGSDNSFGSSSVISSNKFVDLTSMQEFSFASQDHSGPASSVSSQNMVDDMEAEMKRLRLELKQTMDLYSTACKEAIAAKQKAMEMQRWRSEEEQKLEEAKSSEEAALWSVEEERARCKTAVESAEAAQKIAEMEAQKRISLELKTLKDAAELKKAMSSVAKNNDVRYRRYSIDDIEKATDKFDASRKIGEGGYGPVFKCYLDHTPVAVKVLRPDAVQGRSQFQREVEVLSMIRHPNMVLLLGACPEYGILVYEYMARGSLEDCLFRKPPTATTTPPPPLSWQLRFKIAAEIATGLLFLHQTKPEPLVHRDLKPANILLDINFVSKISDVGLARLVPADVAENVTQYHMTSAAGTFCYIDPEYQQTGMLGVKSDVYSLGIILLQIVTGRPPMGLSHVVETAIENGRFGEVVDKDVSDWPMEETLMLAEYGLKCAELRRKDRPDLGRVVLPVLNKLRELAEENMNIGYMFYMGSNPNRSLASTQEVMSDPQVIHSGFSSKNPSPACSQVET
ncbi:U-box domain-containing protein 35 [Linum grandiflorum]